MSQNIDFPPIQSKCQLSRPVLEAAINYDFHSRLLRSPFIVDLFLNIEFAAVSVVCLRIPVPSLVGRSIQFILLTREVPVTLTQKLMKVPIVGPLVREAAPMQTNLG